MVVDRVRSYSFKWCGGIVFCKGYLVDLWKIYMLLKCELLMKRRLEFIFNFYYNICYI